MAEPLMLFPVITAHCIFCQRCKYTVSAPDPERVHHEMEAHYAQSHRREIDRMVARV